MAKLSAAQEKALNEIHNQGYTYARKNTLDSVAKYVTAGPVVDNVQTLKLNADGREVMGLGEESQEATQGVKDIEAELHTNMWDGILRDEAPFSDGVERFQHVWTREEKVQAGFGETLKWSKTKVWDGLTAEEIREDMDTRVPANRADKRAYRKSVRKLMAAL